jgi:hypothetical protein
LVRVNKNGKRGSEMAEYKIEAIIEKLELNDKVWKIQLRGVSKYRFEKTKNDKEKAKEEEKEYWNIFEASNPRNSKLKKQEDLIQITIPSNELGMQHLLSYAFVEKKKLKFELDEDFSITAISHADT